MPTPDKSSSPASLEYDHGAGSHLSGRRYRLLMGLTLLNTLMIGGLLVGPYVTPFVRDKWQQFQAERAMERERLRQVAVEQQVLTHAPPPGKVVYEEDPDEADKLLAGGGSYVPVLQGYGPRGGFGYRIRPGEVAPGPPGYRPPVRAAPPDYAEQFLQLANGGGGGGLFGSNRDQSDPALVFLHERQTPAGERYLVGVWLHPGLEIGFNTTTTDQGTFRVYGMHKARRLVAHAWSVPPPPAQPVAADQRSLLLVLPDLEVQDVAREREVAATGPDLGDGAGGTTRPSVPINYGNKLRLFAGQADPADPSHFTIDYQLDGRRGTIDGRVRNDGLFLRPRAGAPAGAEAMQKLSAAGTSADEAWDLAAPQAASQPGGVAPSH